MSTLPFTKNELFEHVQSQLNRPVIGLFWTGSRINNLQHQLTKTANVFQKVYHNNNTQNDLTKIFSNWVLVNRDIPMVL